MEVTINEQISAELLQNLFDSKAIQYKEDCYEAFVDTNVDGHHFQIRGTDFFNGLSLFTIKITSSKKVLLTFTKKANQLLRFTYLLEGRCRHKLENSKIDYYLEPKEGSMTANGGSDSQSIEVMSDSQCHMVFLEIDRDKYIDKLECDLQYLPDHYQTIFDPKKKGESMVAQYRFNIKVMDAINEILKIEDHGIVRRTNLESLCIKLFAAQVEQYQKEANNPEPTIRESERSVLIQIRDYISENYQEQITIQFLSQKFGLNQQKLKIGFKQLFKNTINKYIQNLRLEKARLLLSNEDVNVSEAARMVGYTNKSYFARKFEATFGSTPKKYQKELKSEIKSYRNE